MTTTSSTMPYSKARPTSNITMLLQPSDKGDMQGALDNFYLAIHSRYDIEKPLAKRFIRRKLDIVNRLKDENAQLKEVVRQKDEERNKLEDYLKKLATEFVILGKECEKENMKGGSH